jgi:hypothetical protein
MANRKEARSTRESNNRSQGSNRSNTGQSRQASEWREMDRQQSGGRGMDTRHASGGRNTEDMSQDMSRYDMQSHTRGGRHSNERGNIGRGNRSQGGRYPIDDLTYDVITVLHEKSKGLEAFDRYVQDAQGDDVEDLLNEIREQDERAIEELQEHLHRLLMEGGRGRRAA